MISFENTIEIRQPVEDVFAFVADFKNTPKWNYFVMHVERTSEGSIGAGTTYHQTRKTDEQDYQIIEYQPGQSIAVKSLPGSSLQFERRCTFESLDDGSTKIRDSWQLDTRYPWLLELLGVRGIKSAVAENLVKLKELLEQGETRLQDGRISTLR